MEVAHEVSRREWADAVSQGICEVPDEILRHAADLILDAEIVITAGNGGSSALASHAAQAIMKPDYKAGRGHPAICLTDAIPTMTAHANDGGWNETLVESARPFLANLSPLMILFSSSGRSENIVKLAHVAKKYGAKIIGFTGFDGNPLRELCTLSIHVNSHDYEVVEPVHDALLHRVQYHIRRAAKPSSAW